MSTLILKNIDTLVTCDSDDRVLHDVDVIIRNGRFKNIISHSNIDSAQRSEMGADGGDSCEVVDCSGMLCYPGLINAHHHLYQYFSRNLPAVQNMELFDWLKYLYEIWKGLRPTTVYYSTLCGLAELMKNGCTTVFDHQYVFPEGSGDLIEEQWRAAEECGMRMHFSRGSMDLSVKDGGLPPDSVVQTVDEIMKDSERLIDRWQDRSFGAMHRIALAPCSPFSVSADLLRESAMMARIFWKR